MPVFAAELVAPLLQITLQVFGRPFVKLFALCYQTVVCPVCLSVLSGPVCNVRVLWPNGRTDQDETWHAGRLRPWPYCVRWGPSSPSPKGGRSSPSFGPYLLRPHGCRDQDATWYGGRTEGLGPGDFVLDAGTARPSQKGAVAPPLNKFGPCLLWLNGWVDQDGSWRGGWPQPRRLYETWRPTPPQFGEGWVSMFHKVA